MKISWHAYLALIISIVLLIADDTKLPLLQTNTDKHDVYKSQTVVANSQNQDHQQAHLMHNRPITQKVQPTTAHEKIKSPVTLHHLVDNYIEREEKQYYTKNRQKTLTSASEPVAMSSSNSDTKPAAVILDGPSIEDDSQANAKGNIRKPLKPVTTKYKRVLVTPFGDKHTKEDSPRLDPDNTVAIEPEKPSLKSDTLDKNTIVKRSTTDNNISKKKPEIIYPKYKVKKGDSLIVLAMKYSVKSSDIAAINNLGKDRCIRIGQKLKIPMSQKRFDIITQALYTVERGDSLGWIANHFNVGLKDLKKYNKLKDKARIRIGQKLILPLPYKLAELKRKAEAARKERLRKKRERERLARIALNKRQEKRFGKLSSKRKIGVYATAYTSHVEQTDSTPFLAAWNNHIRPGLKIIAVSRDLITKYGITNGTKVRISGLRGVYVVRDKMHTKWRRRIDIYMGTNRRRAFRWGKRRVVLYY